MSNTNNNKPIIVKQIFLNKAIKQGGISPHKQNISIIEDRMFFDAFKNIPGMISWKNKDSVYIGCNHTFATINGLGNPEEIIGKKDLMLAWGTKENSPIFLKEDEAVLGGSSIHVLGNYSFADKNRIVLIQKIPIIDKQGSISGIFNYMQEFLRPNITDILVAISEIEVNITVDLVEDIKTNILDAKPLLSNREQECCFFLLSGKTAKEIGKILNISFKTVESNFSKIKMKLECKKISEVIVKLLEEDSANNIPSRFIVKQFEKKFLMNRG